MITAELIGKEEVLARMRARRDNIKARLLATMLGQMARLAEYVRANKLSGQVLRNRTGTLRRSIHPGAELQNEGDIVGLIGTNISYARLHEFGGTFQVPGHWRTITQAFGRPIAPRSVNVAAHAITFPERAFLRPAINERRDAIFTALRGTVMEVMREP